MYDVLFVCMDCFYLTKLILECNRNRLLNYKSQCTVKVILQVKSYYNKTGSAIFIFILVWLPRDRLFIRIFTIYIIRIIGGSTRVTACVLNNAQKCPPPPSRFSSTSKSWNSGVIRPLQCRCDSRLNTLQNQPQKATSKVMNAYL